MKVVLALFVFGGLGIFLVYQFGGVKSFSPAEQAEKLVAEVKPGMTWEEVADQRPPKKYRAVVISELGFPIDGSEGKFDRAAFADFMKNNAFEMGFSFAYTFSGDLQYLVRFDGSGKVTDVEKMFTVMDLVNPK